MATFTHANGLEPVSAFTATINWGDGKTSTGTISLSGTTYTVRGSHSYRRGVNLGNTWITTTVTEVSNTAELLMAKVGDEQPDLPPHHKGDDRSVTGGSRTTAPGSGIGNLAARASQGHKPT